MLPAIWPRLGTKALLNGSNDSSNPATEGNSVFSGTSGADTLSGGFGNDTINAGNGDDIIAGDGPVPGAWHFETFDYNFSSAAGQAFDIENGTRTGSGYVTDFNEGNLTNTIRGTSGNPEDFGVVYSSTLNTVAGGTYRLTTRSDDGSTIQIFDSSGNALNFSNQTGGVRDYLNNDFHQGPTTRFGDVVLDPNETYTIQIRYWENRGGDVLEASINGPDTGGATQNLLTSPMLGLPPGPEYSVTGVPAGIEGDDILNGGAGNDTIDGNGGDDTITGGADNDTITGGEGFDTFIYSAGDGDDTITDFNTAAGQDINDGDQTNNDFLDLTAFYTDIFELRADQRDDGILNQSTGDFSDNTAMGGSITLTGVSDQDLTTDNTAVACFVSGTLIDTPNGPRLIETIQEGDLVNTLDNGPQPVRWAGKRTVDGTSKFAPIRFAPNALGNEAELFVSPQHRMLVSDWRAELLTGEAEVLVAATHLINDHNIRPTPRAHVTYHHLLFDTHELLATSGLYSESFHPNAYSLMGIGSDARTELKALFPELFATDPKRHQTARRSLRGFETQLLETLR